MNRFLKYFYPTLFLTTLVSISGCGKNEEVQNSNNNLTPNIADEPINGTVNGTNSSASSVQGNDPTINDPTITNPTINDSTNSALPNSPVVSNIREAFSLSQAEPLRLAVRDIDKNTAASDERVLSFFAYNRAFDLALVPNQLIANDGQALSPSANGITPIQLYSGKIIDNENSWARITIHANNLITGAIYDGEELFLIDSTAIVQEAMNIAEYNTGDSAPSSIYKLSDVTAKEKTCADDESPSAAYSYQKLVGELKESFAPQFAEGASRQLNVLIVADTQYVASSNGNTQAQVLSQMNIVDGIFSEQMGVQLKISQLVELSNNGTLSSTSPQTLLQQFNTYINRNYDNPGLAHLLTGRDLSGSVIGIAYLGTICGQSGTGLTQAGGRGTFGALTAAHEFGHNFGAPHDNQNGSACAATRGDFLMNPSLNGSSVFSQCSRDQMANRLSSVSCLTNTDTPDANPIPEPTPEPTLSKAEITTPQRGAALDDASAIFSWNRPNGATRFDVLVGTTGPGSTDIRSTAPFNDTSLNVENLPTAGGTVYVRLWTYNTRWLFNDYTYQAANIDVNEPGDSATIQSPAANAILTGASETFSWNRPDGATAYDLIVGTGERGSNNLRASAVFNDTSLTLDNLPTAGETVYVRLWTYNNGWTYNDYSYTAATKSTKAEIASPTPGAALTGKSVEFTWERPAGATSFDVIVGTQGVGSNNIRASSVFNDSRITLDNLPTDGRNVNVRLWTYNGEWAYSDYTYTAVTVIEPTKADINSPTPSSTLDGTTITFDWERPSGALGFDLLLGTNGPGSTNIRSSAPFRGNTLEVSGLPNNGATVYARLWTYNDGWMFNDYTYTAASRPITNTNQATLQSPSPNTTLPSTRVEFTWDRPTGATNFDVIVGDQGAGSNNIRPSSVINTTAITVGGLPSDGRAVNVRLWTYTDQWRYTDYTYQANAGAGSDNTGGSNNTGGNNNGDNSLPAQAKPLPNAVTNNVVRFVYFIEKDQLFDQQRYDAIRQQAFDMQQYWYEQFGGTFYLYDNAVDVIYGDQDANWYIESPDGIHSDSRWSRLGNVKNEVYRKLNIRNYDSKVRVVTYPTARSDGRVGANFGGAWMDGDDLSCLLGENNNWNFPYSDNSPAHCMGHVAHEFGHVFGLGHEGPDTDCMRYGFYINSFGGNLCNFSQANKEKVKNTASNNGFLSAMPKQIITPQGTIIQQ